MKKWFALIALTGCGDAAQNSKILHFDIGNASALFIASSPMTTNSSLFASTAQTDKLFKITEDGYIQEVTFKDHNGEIVTVSSAPQNILTVNDDYIMIDFGWKNNYLVNKHSGAAYVLDIGICDESACPDYSSTPFQSSLSGSVYSIQYWYQYGSDGTSNMSGYSLYEMNLTDPDRITSERISPELYMVKNFFVQQDWILFQTDSGMKAMRPNKSIMSLPSSNYVWRTHNDEVHYFDSSEDKIKRYVFSESSAAVETYSSNSVEGFFNVLVEERQIIYTANSTLMQFDKSVYEVANENKTPRLFAQFAAESISQTAIVGQFIYGSGKDSLGRPVLQKMNLLTEDVTSLVEPDIYDFKKLVAQEDSVLFKATRISDGATVLGKVLEDDSIEIITEQFNLDFRVLVRIR